MSGMDVEPDPITRTALQLLPIPRHREDFWSRVAGALDAATEGDQRAAAGGSAPAAVGVAPPPTVAGPTVEDLEPDEALALVPQALRRTSNAVLLVVAAAAVVVVGLAGSTLLDDRDGTGITSGDDPEVAASLDAAVEDAQPEDTTPSTLSADGVEASSDAVLAWVEDLGGGDGDGAWNAMGSASQAHFGSQAAFEAEMSALAEGYGAWSAAEPDDVLVTPVRASDEGTLAVVTLVGTVAKEGTTLRWADAFPVRIVEGEVVVEPFALAGAIEVVVPSEVSDEGVRSPVHSGEELVIVVPSDADAPILRLDHGDSVVCGKGEGTELTDLEGSPGQRCSYLPPDGMDPGEHTLTMAFLGSDGTSISAGSLLFDAA